MNTHRTEDKSYPGGVHSGFGLGQQTEVKLDRVAEWMIRAQTVVWFTGAGISTESGLPDYRGPQDDRARSKFDLPPVIGARTVNAVQPNVAHYAIVEFEKIGKCDFLISQNVDNLHLRSGYPFDKLAELHGNQRRLRCRPCDVTYPVEQFRSTNRQSGQPAGRFLPRICPACGGSLQGSVINFGAAMPEGDLARSFEWARKAELMIVVGSTCQVVPAANVPRATKKSGGRLVIINIGQTELDRALSCAGAGP